MTHFKKIFRLWRLIRNGFVLFLALLLLVLALIIHFLLTLIDGSGELPHRLGRLWGKGTLFCSGVEIHVRGLEHIFKNGPQIFMANHQSNFDIPVLMGYLPVRFSWTAKKELFRIPLFGFVMKRAGYIQVDRQNHARAIASMELAVRQIRKGTSVMIFPEGTRSSDGSLAPLKKGGIILALKAGVPVVPIGIYGSRNIMPKGSLRITPGTVQMVVGPPIDPRKYTVEQRNELLVRVREAMAECIEQARRSGAIKSELKDEPDS
jgi:1-acyl-sn-glycerol-3-phosphate acyltransferase